MEGTQHGENNTCFGANDLLRYLPAVPRWERGDSSYPFSGTVKRNAYLLGG